jgi:hypothetical protein
LKKSAVLLTIILLLIISGTALAESAASLNGKEELDFSLLDFRNNSTQTLLVNNLELKLDWKTSENTKIYLEGLHDWEENSEGPSFKNQTIMERYFWDWRFGESTFVRLGKDRLAGGYSVYWNPIDFYNPDRKLVNSRNLQKAVEALHIQTYYAGSTWDLISLYPPENIPTIGLKWERITDFTLGINSLINNDYQAVGLNVNGNILDIDLYSETALVLKMSDQSWCALIGGSYFFNPEYNGLVRVEYYLDRGCVDPMTNRVSVAVTFLPVENVTVCVTSMRELIDGSSMAIFNLKYLLNKNLELELELIYAGGATDSVYGNPDNPDKNTIKLIKYF